eukprot:SAG31_NODE_20738_length_566_cov_1.284797_1_plen_79_part_10
MYIAVRVHAAAGMQLQRSRQGASAIRSMRGAQYAARTARSPRTTVGRRCARGAGGASSFDDAMPRAGWARACANNAALL